MDLNDYFERNLRQSPDSIAFVIRDQPILFGEFAQLVFAYVRLIREKSASRVVLVHSHGVHSYAIIWASVLSGATFSVINDNEDEDMIGLKLNQIAGDLVFSSREDFSSSKVFAPDAHRGFEQSNLHVVKDLQTCSPVLYISWTSGTMGIAKAAMIPRDGMSRFLAWAIPYLNLKIGKRWGEISPLSYDLCLTNFFLCSCSGATYVPTITNHDRLFFGRFIQKHGVTHLRVVPAVLALLEQANALDPSVLHSLELVSCGGDKLQTKSLKKIFDILPNIEVINTYGLTETTGFNACCRITKDSMNDYTFNEYVSIGSPVPGWELLIDEDGELIVAGEYIGLGYLDASNYGFESSNGSSSRRFRTGDLAISKDDLYFIIGRKDRQVKIRGNKVHLDELDSILGAVLGGEVHSLAIENEIVSFVQSETGVHMTELLRLVRGRLPESYLPGKVIAVSRMPRNRNGKVDSEGLLSLFHKSERC